MPDSKDREAQAWSDIARPKPRFDYAAHGADAYEEGLEMQRQSRILARLREEEPDFTFTPRPSTTLEW